VERSDAIKAIEQLAEECEGRVTESYSGRGMFGKTCYGVIVDDVNDTLERAGALGLKGGRTDNMGKRAIVYWPSIKGEE